MASSSVHPTTTPPASSSSIFLTISLTVNILLGSGFFAMPLSVHQAGASTSLLVCAVLCAVNIYTCATEASFVTLSRTILASAKPPEVTVVCKVLSSRATEVGYLAVLSLSIAGAMISYSFLFADSVCSIATGDQSTPHSPSLYLFAVLAFALITTPLSLAKVEEQAWLQALSFGLRIALLGVMTVTSLLAKFLDRIDESFPSVANASPAVEPSRTNAFTSLLGVVAFSLFLNSSLPTLLSTLKTPEDKRQIGFVVTFSMVLVTSLIFLLGLAISHSFGAKTASPANLLWAGFKWPVEGGCEGRACRWSSKVVEVLIIFFPALDVLSIYSVNTIILTNNIMEGIWGMDWREEGGGEGGRGGAGEEKPLLKTTAEAATTTAATKLARYEKYMLGGVNLLPIMVALLLPGFSKAIVFTGGISVLLCLVFPAFLGICALRPDLARYGDGELEKSRWNLKGVVDDRRVQWTVLVFGTGLTAIILGTTMV